MKLTYLALKSYAEECDKFEVPRHQVIITATEAARVAQNSAAFFTSIEQDLGLKVQVITGAGEAFYSSKGILFNTKFNSFIFLLLFYTQKIAFLLYFVYLVHGTFKPLMQRLLRIRTNIDQ
jgi:F420-0:gamma-glutamyl ligase-like protein